MGAWRLFRKLECVCVPTEDIDASVRSYTSLGLEEAWRISRPAAEGRTWTVAGLKFPDAGG